MPEKNSDSLEVTLALMRSDLQRMKEDLSEVKALMREQTSRFVTREEFAAVITPIKALIYGLTALLLIATVGAIISQVLIKH